MDGVSWSELYQARKAAARRFGGVFELPIEKRLRDVLLDSISAGDRVLEVGAGDRGMKAAFARDRSDVTYQSMDVDPGGEHDFRNLEEISGPYDCVFALEVVEHMKIEEIGPWLRELHRLLRPGGRLLLSTPNTYYPPAYLRDATHRTPLCYDELAGLVATAGLDVLRVVRIYHDPVHRKMLRRYLFGWLFRLIGIDFARQIGLVAERPR
jgi:2-polyprenyl-3-methyl-5-hydroxy-6-metoxy-1,4-benzoquinol methylase